MGASGFGAELKTTRAAMRWFDDAYSGSSTNCVTMLSSSVEMARVIVHLCYKLGGMA